MTEKEEIKFYPIPIRGTCIACKEKTTKVITILYRNRTEIDCLEWLSTLGLSQRVLQQCLELCPQEDHIPPFLASSFPLLKRILMILETYLENLNKLIRAGKITRLLSSTKIKKVVNHQNLLLHVETKKLEKKLEKSELQKFLEPSLTQFPTQPKRFPPTIDQSAHSLWTQINPDNNVCFFRFLFYSLLLLGYNYCD